MTGKTNKLTFFIRQVIYSYFDDRAYFTKVPLISRKDKNEMKGLSGKRAVEIPLHKIVKAHYKFCSIVKKVAIRPYVQTSIDNLTFTFETHGKMERKEWYE